MPNGPRSQSPRQQSPRQQSPRQQSPHAPSESPRSTRGGTPPSQTQHGTDRTPFLRPEHFSMPFGEVAQITLETPIRIHTGGKFGDQIMVGAIWNQESYTWAFKLGGQQFIRLEKLLTKDLCAWPGQIVPVTIEVFNDAEYIAVVEG